MRDCSSSFAELVQTLRTVQDGTLGSFIPDSTPYSDELVNFVCWCLAVDPVTRGKPEELIEDAWFQMQLGGMGPDEALLDKTMNIVGEFMISGIPEYTGPIAEDVQPSWATKSIESDDNFDTLASDSDDDD